VVSDLSTENILPPIVRNMPGRPKKVRIRNRSEFMDPEDSRITCSECGENGHNKRTCLRRQRGDRIERQ
jgi:hypothetical protein